MGRLQHPTLYISLIKLPSNEIPVYCSKFLLLFSPHTQCNEKSDKYETCFFKVLCVGPSSKQLTKSLAEFVYQNLV